MVPAESSTTPPTAAPAADAHHHENSDAGLRDVIRAGAAKLGDLAERIFDDATEDARPMRRLLAVMARLRAPGGCPWDREQTHETLRQQLVEEVYELLEAIQNRDDKELKEELGDVLLHVVFHSHIAREENRFTFADVLKTLVDKLIRRHPHVFGDVRADNSEAVLVNWNAIKAAEKPERTSALDGVPASLPALMRAAAIQKKAARVGFDWPETDLEGPKAKVREELEEFERELPMLTATVADTSAHAGDSPEAAAAAAAARDRAEDELGDVLFAIVNWSRHLKLDTEEALNRATTKFSRRFRQMEAELSAQGRTPAQCELAELDALWNAVKRKEKGKALPDAQSDSLSDA
ncbi:nucleoside triphosphate pyrophosphohydrolase [Verrucomicrobia bacterium LW23]|nr:nucleoside triphosphate pyrophosphohydrolase [Verrucomicrobia bacterium LW23]